MRPLAVPTLLLALTTACSGPAARANPTAPPEPAPATTPASAPAKGEPVVLDAGAEPRYELRYRAPVGTLRTLAAEIDVTVGIPGLAEPTAVPTVHQTGTVEVLEVADDGAFKTATNLVSPEPLQIEAWFDDRGRQVAPESLDTHNEAMPRLPTQAVGLGARWRWFTASRSNGIHVDNQHEYEIVAVTATTLHLRSTARMTAPRQPSDIAAGVILEGTGVSTTELTLDLTTLIGDLTAVIDLSLSLELGESRGPVTMTIRSSGRWR